MIVPSTSRIINTQAGSDYDKLAVISEHIKELNSIYDFICDYKEWCKKLLEGYVTLDTKQIITKEKVFSEGITTLQTKLESLTNGDKCKFYIDNTNSDFPSVVLQLYRIWNVLGEDEEQHSTSIELAYDIVNKNAHFRAPSTVSSDDRSVVVVEYLNTALTTLKSEIEASISSITNITQEQLDSINQATSNISSILTSISDLTNRLNSLTARVSAIENQIASGSIGGGGNTNIEITSLYINGVVHPYLYTTREAVESAYRNNAYDSIKAPTTDVDIITVTDSSPYYLDCSITTTTTLYSQFNPTYSNKLPNGKYLVVSQPSIRIENASGQGTSEQHIINSKGTFYVLSEYPFISEEEYEGYYISSTGDGGNSTVGEEYSGFDLVPDVSIGTDNVEYPKGSFGAGKFICTSHSYINISKDSNGVQISYAKTKGRFRRIG